MNMIIMTNSREAIIKYQRKQQLIQRTINEEQKNFFIKGRLLTIIKVY